MKKRGIAIKSTKHFWDRVATRHVDLAALMDLYSKAHGTKIGSLIISENQFSKIVAKKTNYYEILLITGYKKLKHKRYPEGAKFKKTDIVIKYTKVFWDKVVSNDIDLTAILDVYSKAAQAKSGDFVVGENRSSKIVARRTSASKIVLITCYKIPTKKEISN